MTIGPESERLRKALQWLIEESLLQPDKTRQALFEEACLRFDLTPVECNYLYKLVFIRPEL